MPRPIDPSSYRSPDPQRPAVPLPIERAPRPHDPCAAFRFGDFALFTAGNLLSITGRLMLAVAVEWEIYARTHSATALGLVGLAIAVPVVTLSLPAGHLADRFSRKATLAILSAITSTVPASAFMETACHSLTAETALREQTIDVYRVDFRRLAAFHPRHQKISGA